MTLDTAGTLWCVGRNYADHAKEMNAPLPDKPIIFIKSGHCLSHDSIVEIPKFTHELHYETEIAVKLDRNKKPSHVALALDLTARDIQTEAKQKGLPWALAKSFKNSCPISSWISFESYQWFENLNFEMQINGQIRQQGSIQNMIFNLEYLVKYLQEFFPVNEGDILLTGTPQGVGPLKPGHQLKLQLMDKIQWDLVVHS